MYRCSLEDRLVLVEVSTYCHCEFPDGRIRLQSWRHRFGRGAAVVLCLLSTREEIATSLRFAELEQLDSFHTSYCGSVSAQVLMRLFAFAVWPWYIVETGKTVSKKAHWDYRYVHSSNGLVPGMLRDR